MKEYVHGSGAIVRVYPLQEYQRELKSRGYEGPLKPPLMPRAFIDLDEDKSFDDGDVLHVWQGALDDFDDIKLVAHEICHALGLHHPDHFEEPVKAFFHALKRGFDLTASTGALRWRKSPKRAWRLAVAVDDMLSEEAS